MQLVQIAVGCKSGDCPTVYTTDRGTVVVQGVPVPASAERQVPEGELLVEVPRALIVEAGRALG